MMAEFDYRSRSVLHLGGVSRVFAAGLAVALAAAVAPAQAGLPTGSPPIVQVSRQQGTAEIGAQIDYGSPAPNRHALAAGLDVRLGRQFPRQARDCRPWRSPGRENRHGGEACRVTRMGCPAAGREPDCRIRYPAVRFDPGSRTGAGDEPMAAARPRSPLVTAAAGGDSAGTGTAIAGRRDAICQPENVQADKTPQRIRTVPGHR